MNQQLSLFDPLVPEKILCEEEFFGKMDALCGMPLRNDYSSKIGDVRFSRYEAGFRKEIERLRSTEETV
jgi:hypothetical protein